MKKILLAFALMVGIAFAHPPYHKRVPPPPTPRYVSDYTVVTPIVTPNGHIEYVRPMKPIYVVLPQVQTKLVVCNKEMKTCDTFVNPDYKIYYDELVVSTPAGTMIYDRDDYTVNISQSR